VSLDSAVETASNRVGNIGILGGRLVEVDRVGNQEYCLWRGVGNIDIHPVTDHGTLKLARETIELRIRSEELETVASACNPVGSYLHKRKELVQPAVQRGSSGRGFEINADPFELQECKILKDGLPQTTTITCSCRGDDAHSILGVVPVYSQKPNSSQINPGDGLGSAWRDYD